MRKDWIDESGWPLVVVRGPETLTTADVHAHFDGIEALLARGEPFGVVVDLDRLRDQTMAARVCAAERMSRLRHAGASSPVAVAHVANHWLGRAVITTICWMASPPFPYRDFRRFEDARRWVMAQLELHRAGRHRPHPEHGAPLIR